MSQKERMRDVLRRDRRDYRQEKMERAARKSAWREIFPDVLEARKLEGKALKAMQEHSTTETRRKYLAARLHRMILEEQARKCWT